MKDKNNKENIKLNNKINNNNSVPKLSINKSMKTLSIQPFYKGKTFSESDDIILSNIRSIFESYKNSINQTIFKTKIMSNILKLPKFISNILFSRITDKQNMGFKEFKN